MNAETIKVIGSGVGPGSTSRWRKLPDEARNAYMATVSAASVANAATKGWAIVRADDTTRWATGLYSVSFKFFGEDL